MGEQIKEIVRISIITLLIGYSIFMTSLALAYIAMSQDLVEQVKEYKSDIAWCYK